MPRVLVFLVGLALFFASFTEAEYMKNKDAKQPLGMRIKNLIKWMTLEEKIGQMTQIERKVASAGSVLSGGDIPPNATKGVPYVAPGKTKVAACAKHFVGDCGTTDGINENNTVISTEGLLKIHMPGYYNSIIKRVSGYYNSIIKRVSTVMMHANREWVTVFLKDTLNFRGIVISDWEASDHITSPPGANNTYSIQASISTGLVMIMAPMDYQIFIDGLTLFKNKFIPMSRIDNAVKRILRDKFVVGLSHNPFADNSLVVMIGREEHTELVIEAVRISLFLLKNREAVRESLVRLKNREAVWESLVRLKNREAVWESLLRMKNKEAVWKSLLRMKNKEAVWKSLLRMKNGEEADGPLLPLSKKAPRLLVEGSHAGILIFFISPSFLLLVLLLILLVLLVILLSLLCFASSLFDLFFNIIDAQ